jgi:hypothetical protein
MRLRTIACTPAICFSPPAQARKANARKPASSPLSLPRFAEICRRPPLRPRPWPWSSKWSKLRLISCALDLTAAGLGKRYEPNVRFIASSTAMPTGKAERFEHSAWFRLCSFLPECFTPADAGSPHNPGTSEPAGKQYPYPPSPNSTPPPPAPPRQIGKRRSKIPAQLLILRCAVRHPRRPDSCEIRELFCYPRRGYIQPRPRKIEPLPWRM